MSDPAYFKKFENFALSRDLKGVLLLRMHTNDEPLVFTGAVHRDMVDLFYEISRDRQNRLLIFTGTGDRWLADVDPNSFGDISDPQVWDITHWEGRKLLQNLLDIEIPVIAAINGPALIHSELVLTCDVILAAKSATFQDAPHLAGSLAPGDGMHVLWPHVLGAVRGRYFLLTQQVLTADQALALGAVNEVVADSLLLDRACALAAQLARQPTLTLRYCRAVVTQRLRRLLQDDLAYGLALEGLNAANNGRR